MIMSKTKTTALILIVLLSLILSACNNPLLNGNQSEYDAAVEAAVDAALEAGAEEVLADASDDPAAADPAADADPAAEADPPAAEEPVEVALQPDDPTPVPPTVVPTCTDKVQFVSDVTVPDNTSFNPNASFTKVWRLKNSGSCTWTSSYALIFGHGDAMNGSAKVNLTSTVNPGSSVDVSIQLKAPAAAGTYQGFYFLEGPNGVFGIGNQNNLPIWVKIKVAVEAPEEPAPEPEAEEEDDGILEILPLPGVIEIAGWIPKTITLEPIFLLTGAVKSTGDVYAEAQAGDENDNRSVQGFMSFNIGGIPDDATISEVKVDFSDFTRNGTPFESLGCLRAYNHTYGFLDGGDWTGGSPLGAIGRWCDGTDLQTVENHDSFVDTIQGKLGSANTFQFRVQFNETHSNNDGGHDWIMFDFPQLIVTYTTP
jgi:hypothetical protein